MARQHHREALPRQEELFLLFGQPHHRHAAGQLKAFQHSHRPRQLALAAIHNQQVGQARKRGVGLVAGGLGTGLQGLPAAEAARQHFFHAGKIIRPLHGLNVEAAVHALGGHALFKNHHAAHRGRALGVGDVVTFDAVGRFAQAQGLLQLCQRLGLTVGVGLPLGAQGAQRFGGVFGGHFHQLLGGALARHADLHLAAVGAAAQPLLDDAGLFDLVGQHHLAGHGGRLGVELLEELPNHLAVGGLGRALQDEIFTPNQLAAADEENLHAGLAFRAGHGNHIRVDLLAGDHFLLFHHPVNGRNLIAQGGGALKAQVFGGLLHLRAQALHHRLGAALQKLAQVVNHRPVGGLINHANARPAAQLDIEVQAGAGIFAGNLTVTGQVGEDAPQHIEGLMHCPDAGIGPVVAGAVFHHLPGDGDLGEGGVPVNLDVGVAFVVFQPDVEARAVLLDQVHFQDQRFQLRADHNPFDVGDLADELASFGLVPGAVVEVRAHPVAQVDRLAHIDNLAGGVVHNVAAGPGGQGIQNLLDALGNGLHRRYCITGSLSGSRCGVRSTFQVPGAMVPPGVKCMGREAPFRVREGSYTWSGSSSLPFREGRGVRSRSILTGRTRPCKGW